MKRGFFLLCVFFFLGCGEASRSDSGFSSHTGGDVYRFNDRPYDTIRGVERDLYNYIFNIIRNKLIFYVLESYPQAPEPFGVVVELDISSVGRGLGEKREAPPLRGWFIFAGDAVPVEENFLQAYRARNLSENYRDMAKATFWVEKRETDTYQVFVRYWNKTMIQEFLYVVKRVRGSYTVVKTEPL
ncbi:MAG: hypothetical protein N2314_04895 [Brevinematales bacterium]|nr:hypothetical protein [Brevinematales bacterium]